MDSAFILGTGIIWIEELRKVKEKTHDLLDALRRGSILKETVSGSRRQSGFIYSFLLTSSAFSSRSFSMKRRVFSKLDIPGMAK